jgi:indole-3-glycerol phosphate synthase
MSVSKKAKQRGTVLDEIMLYRREQLPDVMRKVPLADLRAFASVAPPTNDFLTALRKPGVSLIAECKKASPSKGLISPEYDPVELARAHMDSGAAAISVLTDARYFQGKLKDLRDVREMVDSSPRPKIRGGSQAPPISIFRKDFIFHPYQVYEARVAGADAILLIASVLEDGDISALSHLAQDLSMRSLVEVHDEEELARVLKLSPKIIGINNRNLKTFEVDFDTTARLREKIPSRITVVAESGIKSADDVRRMADLEVDAVLVGTSLLRSKDVRSQTKTLVEAGKAG